jgi:di/tricarboxylate transporter
LTPAMIFLTVVLAAVLVLLLAARAGADLVAVFIVLALLFSGILTAEEAFGGFGSPVVVAIAALFVVSGGLHRTGLSGLIGRLLARVGGNGEARTVVTVMAVGALLSSVITNVAAAAILLPAVMALSLKSGTAPSRLLLPLSYGTILGGTLTLVGSQPNIIASSALKTLAGRDLSFFALTPIGLVLTALGIAYMAVAGRRLLPVKPRDEKIRSAESPDKLPSIYRLDERLFELTACPTCAIAGRTLGQSELGHKFGINVIAIVRPAETRFSPSSGDLILPGDRLIVQGREGDVDAAAREFGLEVFRRENLSPEELLSREIGVAEVVLPPRSPYVGKKLGDIQMRERLGLTVLAIWRGGRPIRARLGEETLQFGDALLVRGPWSRINLIAGSEEFLLVSGTEKAVEFRKPATKMIVSGAVLAAMIVAVVAGALPLALAALGAAALMVVTGCLGPADAYRSVEWRMIIMIGGFLALGTAMVKTGLVEAFVRGALAPLLQAGSLFVLAAIFLLSTATALVTSNITAAVLLCPVAVQAAASLGLDPGTLLVAVVLGATNGFMSPVAQQANMLVMGPGNYVARDYVRAGLGLSVIVFAAVMIFLPLLRGL